MALIENNLNICCNQCIYTYIYWCACIKNILRKHQYIPPYFNPFSLLITLHSITIQ